MRLTLNLLFFCFFCLFAKAQTSYSPCYYIYANTAQELYKNGETEKALIYFQKAYSEAKSWHRTDLIAVAACYTQRDSTKKTFELLHLAMDKGRRFDWFKEVYYFAKLKTDSTNWSELANYEPKQRKTVRAMNFHGLLNGLRERLENGEAAIETAYAFRDLIEKYGLPSEGELDDDDAKNLQLLLIEAAEMPPNDYLNFLLVAKKMVNSGVLRAKDYAIAIDYGIVIRAAQEHKAKKEGEQHEEMPQMRLTYGEFEHANLSKLSNEEWLIMEEQRKNIGLLPLSFDISPESLAK
ncbi:MAG: hypothetical protein RI894_2464, partial [Bacteroidota bacterium]